MPLHTVVAWLTPTKSANCFSNLPINSPRDDIQVKSRHSLTRCRSLPLKWVDIGDTFRLHSLLFQSCSFAVDCKFHVPLNFTTRTGRKSAYRVKHCEQA